MKTVKTGTEETNESRSSLKLRAAKVIRVLTVPPIMALFLTTTLYIMLGEKAFSAPIRYLEAVFTLTLLPVLPYGLCAVIPSWKKRGRKLERTLGIVFSLLGYIMGTLFAVLGKGTRIELILYITYIISGSLLGILTFVFRFKASGHTCGAAGPFALLNLQLGPWWLLGYLVMIPIFISSLRLKRHSVFQLLAGGAVSVGALAIAVQIVGLIGRG